MKIDKRKIELVMARACVSRKELERSGIPKTTLIRAMKHSVRPATAGKIAKVLGVDVTEILETEN